VFLIIKSGNPDFVITIMLDDYLKTNPGVKDLPRPGIEPQPPNPQYEYESL